MNEIIEKIIEDNADLHQQLRRHRNAIQALLDAHDAEHPVRLLDLSDDFTRAVRELRQVSLEG